MSLSQTYVMASKVRVKLAKEAANPESSLRSLVLQANMLDRLMNDIATTSQKKAASKVTFSVPIKVKTEEISLDRGTGSSVTEYEVDSDSEDDNEYSYSSSDSAKNVSDPEEDDYLSDSDDDVPFVLNELHHIPSKTFPVLSNVSEKFLVVLEKDDEDIPELTQLNSTSSGSDSDQELAMSTYPLSRTTSPYPVGLLKFNGNVSVEHISFQPVNNNAAYTIGTVF